MILPDKPSTSNLKTRLCKYYLGTIICKNNENCPFAHNPNEINNKKQRLIETCKYAYDLGLLSPTILQSHLSMKPIPIPGINSNSKIYNCAPNPTQICADQEFFEPWNPIPLSPPNPKDFRPRLLETSFKKITTQLSQNKVEEISLPPPFLTNPSSLSPNIKEEKKTLLEPVIISSSKAISFEENVETISTFLPPNEPSIDCTSNSTQSAIEVPDNNILKTQNTSLKQVLQTPYNNDNAVAITTDHFKSNSQMDFSAAAKELANASAFLKINHRSSSRTQVKNFIDDCPEPNRRRVPKNKHIIRPLPNYQNSCFLNAAIQCLFKIKIVRAALNSPTVYSSKRLEALKRLFIEYPIDLSHPFRSHLYGKISADLRRSLNISLNGQHDAIECFLLLLQELINETIPKTHPLPTGHSLLPKSPFDLKFSYSLTCQNCREMTFLEEKGLSIWNYSKDKNIQAHLLNMEQTGNQKFN